MASDLIGRKLGPYEIAELIAADDLTEMFKGFQPALDRHVLIKIVGRHLPDDPVFNARFRREAKAIVALHHPNIVRVYDFGQAEGGHYVVMDYVEAMTLADVIEGVRTGERTLEPDDITFIVRQIGAALDYAHSQGVLHRAVTPYTINITRSGQAILADFGLSLLYSRAADVAGVPVGFNLPDYMAPELREDARAATPASDIYSLGVVLYELLTGQRPYEPGSDIDMALRDLHDAVPDPRLLNEDIPQPVALVVQKALSKSPKDRFSRAMRLAVALEQAYHPETAPRPGPPPSLEGGGEKLPVARRPTAERVVVRRGLSPAEERREKRRLREEHKRIKRQEREERERIRREERAIARAARRAQRRERRREFVSRWGRSIVVVIVVLLLLGALAFLLNTLGVIHISVALPTLAPRRSAAVEDVAPTPTSRPTVTPTRPPTLTPIPTPTPLEAASATPIQPLEFTPLGVGSSAYRVVDGAVLQFVPAGTFLMGTNDRARKEDARPQHTVMLSDFWIDRTEVTNAQYAQCMASGLCPPPVRTRFIDDPDFANYPVIYVRHSFAVTYCLWLAQQTGESIGLPTEAQWEKAATWDPLLEQPRLYPWGNNPPTADLAQYRGSTFLGTAPVGSHPDGASAYGVLDMAGSVWEWVADWYAADYYQRSGVPLDPAGPLTGTYRVTRGGGWYNESLLLLGSVRNWAQPTATGDDLGFRCVLNTKRPSPESGIVLTPLDLSQALLDVIEAARRDPSNDRATLDEWGVALEALRDAFQTGDNGMAWSLILQRQARLEDQSRTGLLTVTLSFQLQRALEWMQETLAAVG